ncbi:hypothetical protein F4808DRAFT_89253 [Astrocystis sublimbata]|nr:hypothetical protein F4808DRAFT_89253 [Astrocystis sublimbata]
MDLTTLLNTSADEARNGRVGREAASCLNQASTISNDPELRESESPTRDPSSGRSTSRGTGDFKLPSRSRTPWDANGYTMPLINLEIESSPTMPLMDLQINTTTSPCLPKHRLSDSYSSFSSMTSPSTSSISHSRFSSMSTAGDTQSIDTVPDIPSAEIGPGCPIFEGQGFQPLRRDGFPSSKNETSAYGPSRHEVSANIPSLPSSSSLKHIGSIRTFETTRPNEYECESRHLMPLNFNGSSMHKRNLSAPVPRRFNTRNRFTSPHEDISELAPANYVDQHQPGRTVAAPSSWDFPHPTVSPHEEQLMKCEFIKDCNTGSTLRKTVSHVFGRNKLCTRMIPDHVWVHYCRKHYQRKRYRSIQQYALLQCDLVRVQIERVRDWNARESAKENKPGILQGWTLTLRKREQERRQHRDLNEENDDDKSPNSPLAEGTNGTSVPSWLANLCREGYSTDEMLEIVAQINKELKDKNKMHFPDIEILPNLVVDGVLDIKSGAQCSAHKRSQSLNFANVNKRQRGLSLVSGRTMSRGRPTEALPLSMDSFGLPRSSPYQSQVLGSNNGSDTVKGAHAQYPYGRPLPVPRAPRESELLATGTERVLGASGPGGPAHHRSVSDLTGHFPNPNMEFTFRMNGPASQNTFPPMSNCNYYPVLHEYVAVQPEPKAEHPYWGSSSNYSYYPGFPQAYSSPNEPRHNRSFSGVSTHSSHQFNSPPTSTPQTGSNWTSGHNYSHSPEGLELGHLRHQSTPS